MANAKGKNSMAEEVGKDERKKEMRKKSERRVEIEQEGER